MPPSSDDHLQRLEEIVAYLDGELSVEESARVEQRLASDEEYRQQLQSIERAWLALDQLPQEYVDDRFSRTTMEMAVKAAATEVQERTMALPVVQRRRRFSSVLAACAAAALGFLVFRLAWQGPDRALLADLPVVDNVDVYTQFDSPEFIRSLQQNLGDDLHELGCKPCQAPERMERLKIVSDAEGRGEWLSQLDDEERTNLRAKFNRFRQLPADEQQRLRKLHGEIAAEPDAGKLQTAMLVYADWLGGLPPARQFELRTMQPPDERIRTIERWVDEMRDDAVLTLTDEELRRFVRKIREPLEKLQRDAMREASKSNGGRGRNPMMLNQIPNVMIHRVADGMGEPGEFQDAVLQALPERTHEAFKSLEPRQKVDRIMTWLRQTESLQGEVSQEALERFFAEELDAETRAELLSLPSDEMEKALRRMYRLQPGRGNGNPWAWGKGERGDGPHGRDGRGPGFRPGGPDDHEGGPRGPGGMGPGGRRWQDGVPGRGGPEERPNGPPPFRGPDGRFGVGPRPEWDGRGPGPHFEGGPPRPEDFGPPPPAEEPPSDEKPASPADQESTDDKSS
ncbi:MAG: hypothetical protein C0485_00575 [Pirellula sp.]|nr:hypothetical protein [Pirellula sp.]